MEGDTISINLTSVGSSINEVLNENSKIVLTVHN